MLQDSATRKSVEVVLSHTLLRGKVKILEDLQTDIYVAHS